VAPAQALTDERTGRISPSSRGLSNNEINRCLARLRDILDLAREEFGVEIGDPTRRRSLPRTDPPRSWLRPFQLTAIFDAADELDMRRARSGPDYRLLGRKALVALVGLDGPRIAEVGAARWSDHRLDGPAPYLRIREAKTSAGQRDLRLHPTVRDALALRLSQIDPDGGNPLFATAAGSHRDRNSIRTRILAPVLHRAAELLAERGLPPLPERVTAHSFRRTYFTYLASAGVPLRRPMSQAGHKDATAPETDCAIERAQHLLVPVLTTVVIPAGHTAQSDRREFDAARPPFRNSLRMGRWSPGPTPATARNHWPRSRSRWPRSALPWRVIRGSACRRFEARIVGRRASSTRSYSSRSASASVRHSGSRGASRRQRSS
jgi:integrase